MIEDEERHKVSAIVVVCSAHANEKKSSELPFIADLHFLLVRLLVKCLHAAHMAQMPLPPPFQLNGLE